MVEYACVRKIIMTAQKSAKAKPGGNSSPLNLDKMSPDLLTLDRTRNKMKKLGITEGDVRDAVIWARTGKK